MERALSLFSQLWATYFWGKRCSELQATGAKRCPGLRWGPRRRNQYEVSLPWAGWVIRGQHWNPEGKPLESGKNLLFRDLWTCRETSAQESFHWVPEHGWQSPYATKPRGARDPLAFYHLQDSRHLKYFTNHTWAPVSQQRKIMTHLRGGGPSKPRENIEQTEHTSSEMKLLEGTDKHVKKSKSF